MKSVILAGGSGTRFWPYSRYQRPKQLLNIIGEQSMLQMTVDRLTKINNISEIYIVTRKDLRETIINEISGVKSENIIAEPSSKNTAPAIGMIGALIGLEDPDSVMGIFPADHLIVGHEKFQQAINTAHHIAKKDENLVTIGIQPTYPSTAYGYIQMDEVSSEEHLGAYPVKTFAEKPHKDLAKRFISSGDFLWNAGIFFWKASSLLSGIERHMPELYEPLIEIANKIKQGESFDNIWQFIQPESIDYGLLEKSDNILVISAEFEWNDIGSWNALYDVLNSNGDGNIIRGKGKILNGKNNLIQSNGRFTALLGVDDIVVINTDDVTLVVPKDQVEKIKEMVEYLKNNEHEDLI